MFKKATRERIQKHKWSEHSNQTQFFKRIKNEIHLGFKDMILVAKELPEEQLEEIFTVEKITPLLVELLKPKNKRVILITEIMAAVVSDKLLRELPSTIVNTLKADIQKTWVYANMLAEYSDKPLMKQTNKISKKKSRV